MRKRKILIVDFDEEAIRYLSEFLKSENYSVSTAMDGETGLEKCKSEMPDLVIVEPMISKLHGFELCSIITHDFNGKIPVVILTKFYREEQFKIEATRSYGASAFLSKPFKGPDILKTIKNLLKENTKEDEEKDMAEDTQVLDEILVDELISVKNKTAPPSFAPPIKAIEQEILKPRPFPAHETEKKAESAAIKSKIDKMLEDTISEFGLNVNKKERVAPQTKVEFHNKVNILMEELRGEKKPLQTEEKSEDIEIKMSKPESKKAEPKLTEKILKKQEIEETVLQTQEDSSQTHERPIFSEERDDKDRPALFERLISSLGVLKKLPLKFIIPSVLIATLAVSASFYFKKPNQPKRKKAETTDVQALTTQNPQFSEKNVVEESAGQENPDMPPEVPDIKPSAETKAEESQEATVKTRVSEVFQVESAAAQKAPDVNPIDPMNDIVRAEPSDELVEPLLPETEPLKALVEAAESSQEPEAKPDIATNPQDEKSAPLEKREITESPATEVPETTTGDLVPLNKVDIPPAVAQRVEPVYPSLALQRGVGGQVVVNALISENGDVIETAVIRGIKGPYGFNEECEKAVRQWKFIPAFKDGMKVKVWKAISFNFKKS